MSRARLSELELSHKLDQAPWMMSFNPTFLEAATTACSRAAGTTP